MNKSIPNNILSFGDFFRQNRLNTEMTLRSFCHRYGYDPAYISRIERGLLPPPEDKSKLKGFAKALNISQGTEDWINFFDLADISKGKIPDDITANNNKLKYLPLLFRTVRGDNVSPYKIKKLVQLLNKS